VGDPSLKKDKEADEEVEDDEDVVAGLGLLGMFTGAVFRCIGNGGRISSFS
jgi:hypothetical protein